MKRFFVLLLLIGLVSGCSTVTGVFIPEPVPHTTISYDSGEKNSGIIGEVGTTGFEVTKGFITRYNAMIEIYGKKFVPELEKNAGVTELPNKNFCIDNERMVKFVQMNKWRKAGIAP